MRARTIKTEKNKKYQLKVRMRFHQKEAMRSHQNLEATRYPQCLRKVPKKKVPPRRTLLYKQANCYLTTECAWTKRY